MDMPAFLPPPDIPLASAFSRWGDHRHLGAVLSGASRVMALTGAGLSAPSGLPTYRGREGRWTVEEPIRHQAFLTHPGAALSQWRRSLADLDAFSDARPNRGHEALVRLAAARRTFVATQNVDGLHADSGFPEQDLVELHGNGRRAACLGCGARTPLGDASHRAAVAERRTPTCGRCGGLLKPDVVLFGDTLRPETIERAGREAEGCIVFLAAGTSLTVHPAAALLKVAAEAGAVVVIAVDAVTQYHSAAHLLLSGDVAEHLALAVP
jgi:NAD-dependent deacetylase